MKALIRKKSKPKKFSQFYRVRRTIFKMTTKRNGGVYNMCLTKKCCVFKTKIMKFTCKELVIVGKRKKIIPFLFMKLQNVKTLDPLTTPIISVLSPTL